MSIKLAGASALALAGCVAGPAVAPVEVQAPETAEHQLRPPDRTLTLGVAAPGDTRSPDRRTLSTCKGSAQVGQHLDHLYGFEVKETASYLFELEPQFTGVVQVQEKEKDKTWYTGIGCVAAKAGSRAALSLPLNPGFYWVVVDGYAIGAAGPYTLRVAVDTSDKAALRPEQADTVEPLCSAAPPARLGERASGIYLSTPGGARASCGRIGGNAIHKLSLPAAARVRLRASAHFTPAVEIRAACRGAVEACARAPAGKNDVEIVQDLSAGDHFIVLDATEIAPRDSSSGNDRKTAGVAGAYILDIEEALQ
jgi:hypothetical protein